MIAENLFDNIGYTPKMREEYARYAAVAGGRLEPVASAYMAEEISLEEALAQVHELTRGELHPYTADLLFVIACTGYLRERYRQAGWPERIFLDAMKDITCKTAECMQVKHIFGTFVADWYDCFFRMSRVALGRLQFNFCRYGGPELSLEKYGFTLREGDLLLHCHIPSTGPLLHAQCMDAYRGAYHFFRDRLAGGILPVQCSTWMLYPPYYEKGVFPEGSNIREFGKDFTLLETVWQEKFSDMWRVFGVEETDDPKELPQDTALRRRFVKYMEDGGSFGCGRGLLLFDGEKVITRNE